MLGAVIPILYIRKQRPEVMWLPSDYMTIRTPSVLQFQVSLFWARWPLDCLCSSLFCHSLARDGMNVTFRKCNWFSTKECPDSIPPTNTHRILWEPSGNMKLALPACGFFPSRMIFPAFVIPRNQQPHKEQKEEGSSGRGTQSSDSCILGATVNVYPEKGDIALSGGWFLCWWSPTRWAHGCFFVDPARPILSVPPHLHSWCPEQPSAHQPKELWKNQQRDWQGPQPPGGQVLWSRQRRGNVRSRREIETEQARGRDKETDRKRSRNKKSNRWRGRGGGC